MKSRSNLVKAATFPSLPLKCWNSWIAYRNYFSEIKPKWTIYSGHYLSYTCRCQDPLSVSNSILHLLKEMDEKGQLLKEKVLAFLKVSIAMQTCK